MKKGFTLVELLSVIIILGIIASIATVITSNVIESAKKNAVKESLQGIEKASKYYYIDNRSDYSLIDLTTDTIKQDGKSPEKGYIQRNSFKKTRLYIYKDGYCAVKGYSSDDIFITKSSKDECNFSMGRFVGETSSSIIVDNSKGYDLENYRIYGNSEQLVISVNPLQLGDYGTGTNRVSTINYLEVKPNTLYTSSRPNFRTYFYDSSKTEIGVVDSGIYGQTVTTIDNTAYIRCVWFGTTDIEQTITLTENLTPTNPIPVLSLGENSKNLFDKSKNWIEGPTILTQIENGIRLTPKYAGGNKAAVYVLDYKNMLGKKYTLTAKWAASANNIGHIKLKWVKSDGVTITDIAYIYTSGKSATFTLPSEAPVGAEQLQILFYLNVGGTLNAGDYIDYTEIQIEEGASATKYKPYRYIDVVSSGKNLLSYPYYQITKTVNGITFTDNGDGTITANGTATIDADFTIKSAEDKSLSILSGKTVTLSGCPSGGGSSTYFIRLQTKKENVWKQYYVDYGSGVTFTDNFSSIDAINFIIRINSGITVNNLVFKPQLEYGESATIYEPYTRTVTTIDLTGHDPLRKVGDVADYLDYETQKLVRRIGVDENSNLYVLDKQIYEDIYLPPISTIKGYNKISVNGNIEPSRIEIVR